MLAELLPLKVWQFPLDQRKKLPMEIYTNFVHVFRICLRN